MSLRLLAGLIVLLAAFAVPVCNYVLMRWLPPPALTVGVQTCEEGRPPDPARGPCLPFDGRLSRSFRLSLPFFVDLPAARPPGPPPPQMEPAEPPVAVPPDAVAATPSGGAAAPNPSDARPRDSRRFAPRPISISVEDAAALRKHLLIVNLISLLVVTAGAILLFSLVLRRPLRALHGAIGDIERGSVPPAWAILGPAELRTVGEALVRLGAQLRSSLLEREIMLAGLSHDLRSPLARISAAIDLRSESDDDWDGTRRDIAEIDHIVAQCIDFARNGQDEPLSPQSLDEIVRRAVPDAARRGVELQLDAAQPFDMRPLSLTRAVRNLVDNACVHGRPPVRVKTAMRELGAQLRVEDAGAGIDVKLWDEMCKPFSRTNAARHPGGAGLGLAIAARIAALHNGKLFPEPRHEQRPFAIVLDLPRRNN